ncbi:QRFP-like peptide receptor [Glandiceps talaboti]
MSFLNMDEYGESGLDCTGNTSFAAYDGVWTLTEESLKSFLYSEIDTVIVTKLMPIVFIIGMLGNALVIYTFTRIKEMRTVTNYFLVNLAVTDMMYLLAMIPPKLILYYSSPIHISEDMSSLGKHACIIIGYPSAVAVTSSSITIIVLALEKFMAVRYPLWFKTLRTKPKAIVICIFIWIVSIVYCFPEVYNMRLETHTFKWPQIPAWNQSWLPDEVRYCMPSRSCLHTNICITPYNIYYIFDRVLIILVVPLLTILYFLTYEGLKQKSPRGSSAASIKVKKQIFLILVTTTLIYFVCVTPFRFLTLFQTLHLLVNVIEPQHYLVLIYVCRILAYVNSTINPFIYTLLSKRYRRAFLSALGCSKCACKPNPRTGCVRSWVTGNRHKKMLNQPDGLVTIESAI